MNKWYQRWLPTRASLERSRTLRWMLARFGQRDYLWQFERYNMVRAAWIGIYWAMMPMPMQMLPAALFAVLLRANLLVTLAWVWLNNPVTIVPILYASYRLGCFLLGQPSAASLITTNFSAMLTHWRQLLLPLGYGSLVLGVAASVLGAAIVWLGYWLAEHLTFRPRRFD